MAAAFAGSLDSVRDQLIEANQTESGAIGRILPPPARMLVTIVIDPVKVEPAGPANEAFDLAVGAGDVKLLGQPGKGRGLEVTVHNL